MEDRTKWTLANKGMIAIAGLAVLALGIVFCWLPRSSTASLQALLRGAPHIQVSSVLITGNLNGRQRTAVLATPLVTEYLTSMCRCAKPGSEVGIVCDAEIKLNDGSRWRGVLMVPERANALTVGLRIHPF